MSTLWRGGNERKIAKEKKRKKKSERGEGRRKRDKR
jgi:hypothetical protein